MRKGSASASGEAVVVRCGKFKESSTAICASRRRSATFHASSPPAIIARSLNPCARSIARKIRSEEHTSELQSHSDLVCRLLLEKKKKKKHQQKEHIHKKSKQ